VQISGDLLEREFEYKDETWNEIRHIPARGFLGWWDLEEVPFPDNPCTNTRASFDGNSIWINSREESPQRWVFLRYLKPAGTIHAIEYDVTLGSKFSELQFAFNYRSIMDRVRFMIIDNRELLFQCVEKGSFIPPLRAKPVCLEIGRKYHTRIEVIGDSFSYYIDGKREMALSLSSHGARRDDGISLIFFEQSPSRPMDVRLNNIRIYSGHKTGS
jgi:hypothetical protein